MYLDYYSLIEEPFSVTADPKFLYMSEGHEEALSHLLYAIRKQRGFAAITGGVGTGKTTLLNSLLTTEQGITFAFIYQSAEDITELLRYVFKDLGLEDKGYTSKSEYLTALNDFLLLEMEQQHEVVLVIDEAQNLGVKVLEDLRLISNLETSKKKLIQIVLAGQSELREMLALPELRQLNQRIALRYHLGAMSQQETGEYIRHRLKIAGAPREGIFDNDAIRQIYDFSRGVPRLINQVCDASLLKGFLAKKPDVQGDLVANVVASEFGHRQVETSIEAEPAPVAEAPPAREPEPVVEAVPVAATANRRSSRLGVWLAAAVIIILGGFTVWRVWLAQPDFGFTPLPQEDAYAAGGETVEQGVDAGEAGAEQTAATRPEERIETTPPEKTAVESVRGTVTAVAEKQPTAAPVRAQPQSTKPVQPLPREESAVTVIPPEQPVIDASGGKRIRIRRGDCLFLLMLDEYNCVTEPVLQHIMQANPQITNPNIIRIGDFLYLPRFAQSDLASWRLLPSLL